MKKLYNKAKKIHPSPPSISDHLSLLPAAILALTITLSASDKEVLAYLISSSAHPKSAGSSAGIYGAAGASAGSGGDHPPEFHCDCFRCYMSYWVRWDTSENRELIHDIIDAYEDSIFRRKIAKGKKERRKRNKSLEVDEKGESGELDTAAVSGGGSDGGGSGGGEEDKGGECEVGAVGKIVRFIGERIWGVWGI